MKCECGGEKVWKKRVLDDSTYVAYMVCDSCHGLPRVSLDAAVVEHRSRVGFVVPGPSIPRPAC